MVVTQQCSCVLCRKDFEKEVSAIDNEDDFFEAIIAVLSGERYQTLCSTCEVIDNIDPDLANSPWFSVRAEGVN